VGLGGCGVSEDVAVRTSMGKIIILGKAGRVILGSLEGRERWIGEDLRSARGDHPRVLGGSGRFGVQGRVDRRGLQRHGLGGFVGQFSRGLCILRRVGFCLEGPGDKGGENLIVNSKN